MKKNLLVILFAIAVFYTNAQVCFPDPQYTQPGIYPDSATGLPDAYLNVMYNTIVTVVLPYDTIISGMTIKNDSLKVKNWNDPVGLNLPPNFSVACEPPGCVFPGAATPGTISTGCILISGTVTNITDTGKYDLFVDNLAYITITNPPLGPTQSEDVDINYYSIKVLDSQQQPQISFTANPTNGCAPLTVDFTNTSTDGVYYVWYFGDGSPDYFGFDTSHTFTAGGNYWVQVTAVDSNFNPIGYAYTIISVGGSAGFFEMGADSVCPGDNVNFRGQDGVFDYQWDFGDGAFASGSQWESHTYTSTGTFPVTLIVSDACGMDTIIQNIFVGNNVTPQSDFNIWPTEVCPNQPVEFYNNNVGNNYQWNFGDGSNGNGQYITHPYSNLGSYNITCVVTNSCGNSSTSSATVLVSSNAPFPWGMQVNHWPQPACPGAEIFFSVPSGNASYIWNFGDGTPNDTSATNEVSHSFAAVGTYNVSVNITSFCGNDTTIFTTVEINNNVPFNGWFDINVGPSPACPGSTVYFDSWSNDAVSYQWNFGDGGSSTNQNTNHIYPNTGNYNATLTLTNQCGSDTIIPFIVNINNNVMPDPNDYDYGVTVDTACSGDSILFYIAPGNSGTYLWNFGDGSSTSTTFPYTEGGFTVDLATHVYANNGVFNVVFTLTNQCGNSFTDSFTVTVGGNVPVDGDLWTNGENFCPDDTIKFTAVGGGTYVWNFGDGTAPFTSFGIITDVFHAFNFSGEYAVSVNITNSCGNSALYTDTISVDSCFVGIKNDFSAEDEIGIFPNPNKGEFTLQRTTNNEQRTTIKIYNVLGEIVYSKQLTTNIEQLSTNLQSGIYFVKIESVDRTKTQKIIIE